MVQRQVLVRDAGHQLLDELDAADIPDLSATYDASGAAATAASGAASALSTHAGAVDPHTVYALEAALGTAAAANTGDFDAAGAAAAAQSASQPLDSDLTAFAGLAIAADKLPYGTGSHTLGLADLTAAGRAILDDADASAQRTTLGITGAITGTKLDDLSSPDDNTDLNASASAHGLLPKWPNNTTSFLRGDGTYATPTASVNPSGADVSNSGTQAISASTDTALTFDSETSDTDAYHSTSANTSRITIPSGFGATFFSFVGTFEFASSATGLVRVAKLRKNGSTIIAAQTEQGVVAAALSLQVSQSIYLADGDYIELIAYQDTLGSLNVSAGARLTVVREGGPAGPTGPAGSVPTRASLGLDTTDSPQFAGVNVGAATDTTITRVSAGVVAVEGATIYAQGGALGTPASGVATNLTGTAAGLTAGSVTTNANLTGDVTSVGNATTIPSLSPLAILYYR